MRFALFKINIRHVKESLLCDIQAKTILREAFDFVLKETDPRRSFSRIETVLDVVRKYDQEKGSAVIVSIPFNCASVIACSVLTMPVTLKVTSPLDSAAGASAAGASAAGWAHPARLRIKIPTNITESNFFNIIFPFLLLPD